MEIISLREIKLTNFLLQYSRSVNIYENARLENEWWTWSKIFSRLKTRHGLV